MVWRTSAAGLGVRGVVIPWLIEQKDASRDACASIAPLTISFGIVKKFLVKKSFIKKVRLNKAHKRELYSNGEWICREASTKE